MQLCAKLVEGRDPVGALLVAGLRFLVDIGVDAGVEGEVRVLRLPEVERHVDASAAQCRVPPLVLQPLVENAVTHGIAALIEGGVIRLDVARRQDRLSITIENPRDTDTPARTRRGVGLDNVRQRLTTMFGADARIETRADEGRYRVELAIPCFTDD